MRNLLAGLLILLSVSAVHAGTVSVDCGWASLRYWRAGDTAWQDAVDAGGGNWTVDQGTSNQVWFRGPADEIVYVADTGTGVFNYWLATTGGAGDLPAWWYGETSEGYTSTVQYDAWLTLEDVDGGGGGGDPPPAETDLELLGEIRDATHLGAVAVCWIAGLFLMRFLILAKNQRTFWILAILLSGPAVANAQYFEMMVWRADPSKPHPEFNQRWTEQLPGGEPYYWPYGNSAQPQHAATLFRVPAYRASGAIWGYRKHIVNVSGTTTYYWREIFFKAWIEGGKPKVRVWDAAEDVTMSEGVYTGAAMNMTHEWVKWAGPVTSYPYNGNCLNIRLVGTDSMMWGDGYGGLGTPGESEIPEGQTDEDLAGEAEDNIERIKALIEAKFPTFELAPMSPDTTIPKLDFPYALAKDSPKTIPLDFNLSNIGNQMGYKLNLDQLTTARNLFRTFTLFLFAWWMLTKVIYTIRSY